MKSACAIAAAILIASVTARLPPAVSAQGTGYADLVSLFADWRAFQKPKVVDGVPDYTAAAMAAQQRGLADYQRRLAALKAEGWPAGQQVTGTSCGRR
jgi:hypothetical protein